MIFWIWAATIFTALYFYFRETYSRFSRYGVKHLPPIPLLGTLSWVTLGFEHMANYVERVYNGFPEERFVGNYELISPVVLVRDLELIKKITVRDFEHFLDHRIFIDKKVEPYIAGHLLSLKGQEWKDMRSTLTPAFTSSKIRLMVPYMLEVGEHMIEALNSRIEASGVGYIDVDVKDLTTRYANDVIATCAFGLEVNSHRDEKNPFYVNGRNAVDIKFWQLMKFKFGIFSEATRSFFRNAILGTVKDREERNIIRPDMIHLLMQARKGNLSHDIAADATDADTGFATVEESDVGKKVVHTKLTDDDLIAQAVIFYVAGYETVSTTMSFLLHELALAPDVQGKLVQEIKENNERNGGKFDFNSVQHMPYLDSIVSEVMRLWPAVAALDRVCVKDYNMGKPNAKSTKDFIIRKGEGIQIPTWAIHRNPEFYPNPNKFDPERFSEENKHNTKPFTYMPFGLGPRNCIGSRFALCEVKVMLYHLLQKIEVSIAPKTCIPSVLVPNAPQMRIKGGHWVRMKLRK